MLVRDVPQTRVTVVVVLVMVIVIIYKLSKRVNEDLFYRGDVM